MNYKDILELMIIKKVKVKGNVLIVNDNFNFKYSHSKVAKAVANKLKNFINIK